MNSRRFNRPNCIAPLPARTAFPGYRIGEDQSAGYADILQRASALSNRFREKFARVPATPPCGRCVGSPTEKSPESPAMRVASGGATKPQTSRTITAPTIEPAAYKTQPRLRHDTGRSPALGMSRRTRRRCQEIVVSMNPVGSLGPEWISFAITPATNPMMIVHRICIRSSMLWHWAGAIKSSGSTLVDADRWPKIEF